MPSLTTPISFQSVCAWRQSNNTGDPVLLNKRVQLISHSFADNPMFDTYRCPNSEQLLGVYSTLASCKAKLKTVNLIIPDAECFPNFRPSLHASAIHVCPHSNGVLVAYHTINHRVLRRRIVYNRRKVFVVAHFLIYSR